MHPRLRPGLPGGDLLICRLCRRVVASHCAPFPAGNTRRGPALHGRSSSAKSLRTFLRLGNGARDGGGTREQGLGDVSRHTAFKSRQGTTLPGFSAACALLFRKKSADVFAVRERGAERRGNGEWRTCRGALRSNPARVLSCWASPLRGRSSSAKSMRTFLRLGNGARKGGGTGEGEWGRRRGALRSASLQTAVCQ